MAKLKRPTDINQRAKNIVDIDTGNTEDTNSNNGKNPGAVELGRLGGKVGGKARAASLTPEQRSDFAKKAAAKRWNKNNRYSRLTTVQRCVIPPLSIEEIVRLTSR